MNRRSLLVTLGVTASLPLAGCVGSVTEEEGTTTRDGTRKPECVDVSERPVDVVIRNEVDEQRSVELRITSSSGQNVLDTEFDLSAKSGENNIRSEDGVVDSEGEYDVFTETSTRSTEDLWSVSDSCDRLQVIIYQDEIEIEKPPQL